MTATELVNPAGQRVEQSFLIVAIITVAFELLTLAWIRGRFFCTGFLRSFASVTLAGAIIAGISAVLGAAGSG
ncbi:MAG: hypothetical protein WCF33_06375 [Pseudonocardiaceae bacterium]